MNPIERRRRRRRRHTNLALGLAAISTATIAAVVAPRVRDHRAALGDLEGAIAREVEPIRQAVDLSLFRGTGLPRLEAAEQKLLETADPEPFGLGFEGDLGDRIAKASGGEIRRVERTDPVRIAENGVVMHATPVEVAVKIPAAALHDTVTALTGGDRPGMITDLRVERPTDDLYLEIVATLHFLHATHRMPMLTR